MVNRHSLSPLDLYSSRLCLVSGPTTALLPASSWETQGAFFIGYGLAALGSASSLNGFMGINGETGVSALFALLIPATVLAVPIFDTTLVTITRKWKALESHRGDGPFFSWIGWAGIVGEKDSADCTRLQLLVESWLSSCSALPINPSASWVVCDRVGARRRLLRTCQSS